MRSGKNPLLRAVAFRVLGWLLTAMVFLAGCATKRLPEHPTQPVTSYPYSQVTDGLAVAVQPLTSGQESEKYFGTDLLSNGILAVFVFAENRSSPASFLVSKEQFSLRANQVEAAGASRREQLRSEVPGQVVAIAGAALISFPLFFAGTKLISDASVIKYNFTVKELQAKTLSSGENISGFVYFQLPQGRAGVNQWTLHFEARDLSMKAVKSFDFTFEGGR